MKSQWTRFKPTFDGGFNMTGCIFESHIKTHPKHMVIVRQDFRSGDWLIFFCPNGFIEHYIFPSSERERIENSYAESSEKTAMDFAKKYRNNEDYW